MQPTFFIEPWMGRVGSTTTLAAGGRPASLFKPDFIGLELIKEKCHSLK
jgi:hypothetical protein